METSKKKWLESVFSWTETDTVSKSTVKEGKKWVINPAVLQEFNDKFQPLNAIRPACTSRYRPTDKLLGKGERGSVYIACRWTSSSKKHDRKVVGIGLSPCWYALKAVKFRSQHAEVSLKYFIRETATAMEAGALGIGPPVRDVWICEDPQKEYPHIKREFEGGTTYGFIVTDLLYGQTLEAELATSSSPPLTAKQKNAVYDAVAVKLRQLHRILGVAHGDIGPGNVWIVSTDPVSVRLIDFGDVNPSDMQRDHDRLYLMRQFL